MLRTVAVEALILVAVLAVTAVLVNVVPGRTDATTSGPFVATQPFRTGQVSLTITPNQPGVNSFHVDFLDPSGRPTDLAQKVTIELRLPEKDLGPFESEMVKAGTGHFILEGVSDMSITGTWQITLNVRVSDFDQERVTFTDTIG
jgi:copper transport protein